MTSSKQPRGPLTEDDKQYIRDNHKTTSMTAMAKNRHRLTKNVGKFMEEEGLTKFVSTVPPGHTLRKQNERLKIHLDAMRTHNRIIKAV